MAIYSIRGFLVRDFKANECRKAIDHRAARRLAATEGRFRDKPPWQAPRGDRKLTPGPFSRPLSRSD